tara:strand:+ start:401 stop:1006 length:606 start_codon:yes stop_codon:yes gene_type:complete
MRDKFFNRRWIFLTSGDIATKVDFNHVLETSTQTCRYNVAPPSEKGTKSFVKYEIVEYPQDKQPEITIYSGFYQESPSAPAIWAKEYNVPLQAVQSSTDDTYRYEYEITGSGANLEWDYLTGSGGDITGEVVVGTGYYPLYSPNILSSGLLAPSGMITGRPACYEYALDVEFSGETKKEFKHSEMLSILTGSEWTLTGLFL